MAITNVKKQVLKDLKDKIELEGRFRKELKKVNRDIIETFRSDIRRGQITSAENFRPEFEELLTEHYERVADKFEGRIIDEMPADVAITPEEAGLLAAALALFIPQRAIRQSTEILSTTQSNMRTALRVAAAENVDQIEFSLNASVLLNRQLVSRETGIVSLETQTMAETVKRAEVDALTGKTPLSNQAAVVNVDKEWVTVGDEVVRPAHVIADSQVRPVNEPFIVGGERLKHPGDMSLGASLKNVVNCRCSSVYDNSRIVTARRELFIPDEEEDGRTVIITARARKLATELA